MKNKNFTFFTLLLLIGIITVSLSSFTKGTIHSYQESNDSQWENLKVLPQDISKDSLFTLMKGYNIALGVKCSHCHSPKKKNSEELDFADDSKVEKHIARAMITMTHDINGNYFNYKKDRDPAKITDVTCAMCHRGNPNPKHYLNNIGKYAPGGER